MVTLWSRGAAAQKRSKWVKGSYELCINPNRVSYFDWPLTNYIWSVTKLPLFILLYYRSWAIYLQGDLGRDPAAERLSCVALENNFWLDYMSSKVSPPPPRWLQICGILLKINHTFITFIQVCHSSSASKNIEARSEREWGISNEKKMAWSLVVIVTSIYCHTSSVVKVVHKLC